MTSSWQLFKQSWDVLRADTHLILFPILSTISCMLVLISFAIPAVLAIPWAETNWSEVNGGEIRLTPLWYLGLFAFYLVNFFVITFFNSALVACASNRFQGKDSSARAGLAIAVSRLPQILAWSILSATVGVILRTIAERTGFIGSIIIRLVGMAWSIATYFVVPILVIEGTGPIDSVKRSIQILRKNWGESLTLHLGMGLIGFLMALGCFLPLAAGIGLSVALQSPIPGIVGGAVTVLALLVLSLVASTLKVIIQTALYRFAETGAAPAGFETALLQSAIRPKM